MDNVDLCFDAIGFSVEVQLSNNAQDWFATGMNFTYRTIPSGHYLNSELVVVPCPPGSFCSMHGEGSSRLTEDGYQWPADMSVRQISLCPPGTYQDAEGQVEVRE